MSIFKRLRDLTMSNINAIIDKAEDPIKMTDQYIRDMQGIWKMRRKQYSTDRH